MDFGDLKIDSVLQSLNDCLKDKSYIEEYVCNILYYYHNTLYRYVPSQGDVAIFDVVSSPPSSKILMCYIGIIILHHTMLMFIIVLFMYYHSFPVWPSFILIIIFLINWSRIIGNTLWKESIMLNVKFCVLFNPGENWTYFGPLNQILARTLIVWWFSLKT